MLRDTDIPDTMVVLPKFRGRRFKENPKLCFVLMPFGDQKLDSIYHDVIKPEVEKHGLQCVRADEISSDDRIMEDIWRNLCEARMIVCDLTRNNPNVYYELGLCHVLGKRTVLITQEPHVPFDIHSWRCIVYSDQMGKARKFAEKLGCTIERILSEPRSPVFEEEPAETRARKFASYGYHWEASSIYLLEANREAGGGSSELQVEYMEKAIEQFQAGGYSWEAAENLIKLAGLHSRIGRREDQLQCLKRAADVYMAAHEHWEAGQQYFSLGKLHKKAKEVERAIDYFRLAREQFEHKGYDEEISMCDNEIHGLCHNH